MAALLAGHVRPAHFGIFVRDHDAAVAWYTQVMGCQRTHGFSIPGYVGSFLTGGGFQIEIVQVLGQTSPEPPPVDRAHLAFLVEDLDRRYALAKSLGLTFFIDLTDNPVIGARFFHVQDPDGHVIEFMQAYQG
ncbi:MAG: VOC family protein [Bernardetiaceae bacterium]|jgi:catechol 2,3-dioxygenase-like lactoylglutathione lyase family enzyme|nr:VOC family protein [Bernardetiaceae bacterium]